MLQEIYRKCNYLIVGLQSDPTIDRPEKNKPIETLEERKMRLLSCRYVQELWTYDTEDDLYFLLRHILPDVRFVGEDWRGKRFTGDDLPIKIVYNKRDHNYSSSNLRKRVYEETQRLNNRQS